MHYSDVKILAKALSLHLKTTMHDVVSVDQTGFTLGCQSQISVGGLPVMVVCRVFVVHPY